MRLRKTLQKVHIPWKNWPGLIALGFFTLIIALAAVQHEGELEPVPLSRMAASTVTRTPFRAQTFTPTPSFTPSPTWTSTPTPSPSATFTPTMEPTLPPPSPTELPAEAVIKGVVGHPQTLALSCESRSAVDWAAFFGTKIGELEFLNALPRSDNPEKGFVGDPNGVFGQIPPNPYGVHAAPVGALLRAYGIPAEDERGMSWDELRAEIADGQPVIVWVIGSVWWGKAVPYEASDGETVMVAPMEHTVIVIGYSPYSVAVLDNHLVYSVPIERFLASWGVLGNQAVYYR